MKNFKLCNDNSEKWFEADVKGVKEVIYLIKSKKLKTFTICWKSPVTKEYSSLVTFENGVKMFENEYLNIPKSFLNVLK